MSDRYMVIHPDTLEAMHRAGHIAKLEARIEKLEAENAELRSQINTVQIAAKYAAKIRDDRIEKLEAALRNIAEGDMPRTVKAQFRDDGKPSKHDRCEHGQWMYEECGCCVEDYAREVLK